ncbi:hypothetical protein K458DRAFT_383639 [Lentithecium fluviatile CBS 122367]|uniref:Uncharacterized protein n=1 Tax=Lentithecium fluviatile CBS 122367 TaxID=1168545 RepID=A0A6G1JJY5_9PLEO|nr:hypothetical protein K458DRAFT_383639 [Lentithecium fluviatile CBS 122367]
MASRSSFDLSWSSPELARLLETYSRSSPDFSLAMLNFCRSEFNYYPNPSKTEEFFNKRVVGNGPNDYGPIIDVDMQPMFDFSKFITDLPMDEVRKQLLPALRLATMLITHPSALEWFVYVCNASLARLKSGSTKLVADPEYFTPVSIQTVQIELVERARCIRIFGLVRRL